MRGLSNRKGSGYTRYGVVTLAVLYGVVAVAVGACSSQSCDQVDFRSIEAFARALETAAEDKDLMGVVSIAQKIMRMLPERKMYFAGYNAQANKVSVGVMKQWAGEDMGLKLNPLTRDVVKSAHLAHEPSEEMPKVAYIDKGSSFSENDGPDTYVRDLAKDTDGVSMVYTVGNGSYNVAGVEPTEETCAELKRRQPDVEKLVRKADKGRMVVLSSKLYCPETLLDFYPQAGLLEVAETIINGEEVQYVKRLRPLVAVVKVLKPSERNIK